jgi:tRNA (guanine-N7-)-methyltransferase
MSTAPSHATGPTALASVPRLPEGDVDPRLLLGANRVELELGPGNGAFLLGRLDADPEVRIFGLEIRRKWALGIHDRIERRGALHRARAYAEDARDALPRLTNESICRVYVHFPDPWWKKRHLKRRVLQLPLVDQLARVLSDGGELFVQTDVPERANDYEELLSGHPAFAPLLETARVPDPGFGARSARERRAIQDELPIVRLHYRRATR